MSRTVPDDRVHLEVYGIADTVVSHPERAELSADVLALGRGPARPDPSAILGWLDDERRGVAQDTVTRTLIARRSSIAA